MSNGKTIKYPNKTIPLGLLYFLLFLFSLIFYILILLLYLYSPEKHRNKIFALHFSHMSSIFDKESNMMIRKVEINLVIHIHYTITVNKQIFRKFFTPLSNEHTADLLCFALEVLVIFHFSFFSKIYFDFFCSTLTGQTRHSTLMCSVNYTVTQSMQTRTWISRVETQEKQHKFNIIRNLLCKMQCIPPTNFFFFTFIYM